MSLLVIILVLVAVGVLLWLVETYVPMDATIKRLLMIVVIVFLVIWLMKIAGLWDALLSVKI